MKPPHIPLKAVIFALLAMFSGFLVYSHAQVQEVNPITFGGGVDYKTDCSEIQDDRACDSNNWISYYTGTSQKRYGSKRVIEQAISSVPVQGLFRAHYSTGTTIYKATLMINDGKIYVDTTTTGTGHIWTLKKSGLDKNQNYEFKQYASYVVIAGDSLNDRIMRYSITSGSVTEHILPTTSGVDLTAKHHIFAKNYYITANIKEMTLGTTYYPARLQYSLLAGTPPYVNELSSMTAFRAFEIDNTGEEIMGLGEIGSVFIFSPSSIYELTFSVLNLGSQGGDIALSKVVQGFGCISPRTLVNTGRVFVFLGQDGIRLYDPSARDSLAEETKLISTAIEPVIKRMLENGTYKNAHAIYYAKRNWYIFTFEDPTKSPQGSPNSTLVCDLNTGEWFPLSNWLPECYAYFDNINDKQEIIYGDNQGYVHYFDQEEFQNDARKELVIDNCDLAGKWLRASAGAMVKEGTASIKTTFNTVQSSIALMGIIDLGEWYDKSKTTTNDKISFKVYPSRLANLQTIRIDLEMNTVSGDFDTYFTSVTISSSALTSGTSNWSTVEIPLSSFPILNSWIQVSSGVLPFADSPTFYGLRFVSTSIAWCELTYDDVRFVGAKEYPLNAFRKSKQFSLGTEADKKWQQVFINCDKPATSKFYMDTYDDFGNKEKRNTISNLFDKDIFLTGYNGHEGIFRLDGNDFTLNDSTQVYDSSVMAPRPITGDDDFIYVGDQYHDSIIKFKRSDLTASVSSAGSTGSGSANFNKPFQMAVTKKNEVITLYICDFVNHKVKVYNGDNMKLKKSFGELGKGTTNFNFPTGICADDDNVFTVQDANHRLQKWDKDFVYKDSVVLNLNTVGNTRLAIDQESVYVFYSKISDNLLYSECWLEKRNKSDLKLVSKTRVLPENVSVVASTYCVMGDIGINDDFIYITFMDGLNVKAWTQTSAADWNSGLLGDYLNTDTVSGDIVFGTRPVILRTSTFNYTGAIQMFTIPQGVSSINVTLWGAQGGTQIQNPGGGIGGRGGAIYSTVAVTSGQTLYLLVGGSGTATLGGWNGGGNGVHVTRSAGGGGATDIRIGGSTWTNRILVAGGGGGANFNSGLCTSGGGGAWGHGKDGGGSGTCGGSSRIFYGSGGTQLSGGLGGYPDGNNGDIGNGGNGGGLISYDQTGSGGGGGFYGGGGSGSGYGCSYRGSAGGGSSYSGLGIENVTFTSACNAGNGSITISYFTSTDTYVSNIFNCGRNVNTFNTFNVSEDLYNGTITYRIFTDTDSVININDSNTFIASQTITNGSIPTIEVKQYLTLSAKFESESFTSTPTLHSMTLNFDRSNLLQTYGKYNNQDISTLYDNTTLGDFTVPSRNYYLQKRLKDGVNFPIIKERKSTSPMFGVASNGLTYKPKRQNIVENIGSDSAYLQFKFSEDELDNSFKLYKLSPLVIPKQIKERP